MSSSVSSRRLRLLFTLLVATATVAPAVSQTTVSPAVSPTPEAPAVSPTADAGSDQDFQLRLGGFLLSDISITLQLDAGNQNGTPIDFVGTLGGDSTLNVLRFDGSWHFAKRHQVDFSWFDIDLNSTYPIKREIIWGDETFAINTQVDTRFRTNIYKLSYGYLFKRTERHDIIGLIGAHIVNFETSIGVPNLGRVERFSVTAPLPAFGVAWNARWNDRLTTTASLQYFGLSLDDGNASGDFTDLLLAVQYRLTRNFGVGGGYNRFDLDVELNKEPLRLTLNHSYNGFLLYVFAEF